jgi:hypothetical protein
MERKDSNNSTEHDQKEKLDHLLKIYVSEAEKIKLVRMAEIVGISFSAFGRAVLLEYKFEKDLLDLRKIRYELNKIGVNLNQLAKVANQKNKLPKVEQIAEFKHQLVTVLEEL